MSFFKKSLKLSNFENIGSYAKKLASTIDEKTKSFVNEITKEDNGKSKSRNIQSEYPFPWSDEIDEDTVKDTIFALSMDERNFLIAPSKDDNFEFDLNENLQFAINLLKADKRLEKLRYNLVPKQIKEDLFWKNYFFRIHLIKCGKDIQNLPNIFLPEIIPKANDATIVNENKKKPEEIFSTDVFDNSDKIEEEEELLKSFEKEIDDAIQLNQLDKNKNKSEKVQNENKDNEINNDIKANNNNNTLITGIESEEINDTSSLDETMNELEKTLKNTI